MLATEPVTLHGGLVLHKVVGADAEGLKSALTALTVNNHLIRACSTTSYLTFPGPQPVSIDRGFFHRLRNQPYFISEKSDGVRYAMLVCTFRDLLIVALFDRALTPYLLPIRETPRALAQNSILDGELVYDNIEGRWVYLIFDAVMVSDIAVVSLPFAERLEAVGIALTHYTPAPPDPAVLRIKKFIPVSPDVQPTYSDHVRHTSTRYKIDGIVFMPALDHVMFGRHDGLFKLKQKHTLDFLARNGKLHIYDESQRRNKAVGSPAGPHAHLATDGAIVECEMAGGTSAEKQWTVLSVRTDKKLANNKLTFEKTLLNIKENLQLDHVLEAMFAEQGLTERGTVRWE